jgi:hypothetical protein
MYKNIEILDKSKHQNIKFDNVTELEIAKNIGVVPIGVDEVLDMSCIAPVIISAGDNAEFITVTGISNDINIYQNESLYKPSFVKSYPFFNITVKDNNEKLTRLIAIDKDDRFVGKKKNNSVFTKENQLEEIAANKIDLVRKLDKSREISKIIVKELQKNNLLTKKDFRVKIGETERIILKEFYVVNGEELLKLDDTILALWAKKGWMGIIDAHTKSLGNFQKIVSNK